MKKVYYNFVGGRIIDIYINIHMRPCKSKHSYDVYLRLILPILKIFGLPLTYMDRILQKKSRIRETKNLSTDLYSRTDTIFEVAGFIFFFK